jgi:hypothetical protein
MAFVGSQHEQYILFRSLKRKSEREEVSERAKSDEKSEKRKGYLSKLAGSH